MNDLGNLSTLCQSVFVFKLCFSVSGFVDKKCNRLSGTGLALMETMC